MACSDSDSFALNKENTDSQYKYKLKDHLFFRKFLITGIIITRYILMALYLNKGELPQRGQRLVQGRRERERELEVVLV